MFERKIKPFDIEGEVLRDANTFAVQNHFQEIGGKKCKPFVIEGFQIKPSDLVCRW